MRLTIVFHMQACLKEIHTKKLHEHLLHLEQPLEDENEDKMEQEVEMDADHSLQVKDDDDNEQIIGMVQSLYLATRNFTLCLNSANIHNFSALLETQAYSPNLLEEEENQEAGSFSPELMHGDEDEEAVDPEEDRAILVSLQILYLLSIYCFECQKLDCYKLSNFAGTETYGCLRRTAETDSRSNGYETSRAARG